MGSRKKEVVLIEEDVRPGLKWVKSSDDRHVKPFSAHHVLMCGEVPVARLEWGGPFGTHRLKSVFVTSRDYYDFEHVKGTLSEKLSLPKTKENIVREFQEWLDRAGLRIVS